MKRVFLIFGVLAVLVAGCSSDDDSSDDSSDTTAAADDDGGDDSDTSTTSAAGGCADETSIEIVNAEAAGVDGFEDGELDVVWTLSEGGPHPDNTTDEDATLGIAFATFEIEPDEQFGVQIPLQPDVPDGEVFYNADLGGGGTVEAGTTYADQLVLDDDPTAADGSITFVTLEYGTERILPLGDMTITITEIDDDVVCGEITTVTDTDLQSFPGLEGEFVLDREQALSD